MSARHRDQQLNDGLHAPLSWTFANAAARTSFTPTSGFPSSPTSVDVLKFALQLDDNSVWVLTSVSPITWEPVASVTVAAHASTHENGGIDEINVSGLSGILADPQTPAVHTHAANEIVSGTFADARIAQSNVTQHEAALSITESQITDISPANTAPPTTALGGPSVLGSVSTEFAREDHTHGLATGTAVGLTANTTNTEGIAGSAARSDHTHDIDTTNGIISTIEATDTAQEGTGTGVSRRDHQHAVSTANVEELDFTAQEGTGLPLARADHRHPFPKHYYGVKTTQVATTSSSFIQAARMTWSGADTLPAGDYTLWISAEIFNTDSKGHMRWQVQINDSFTVINDVSDKSGRGKEGTGDHVSHALVFPYTHAGGTINLDFDILQLGSGTAQIRNMRAVFIPCVSVSATSVV